MGAWGTGISSNDTYADVYDRFFDLYNDGLSVSEASSKLIRENQETIGISEDAPNFWYALAKAQWECKELAQEVLARVEHYIQTGEDLKIWKELGATESDLKSRHRALSKFLTKLRSEKTSAKKRKKKKFYDSIFRKGDCLVYKMENGNYGGAFVLTDEQMTVGGVNYIAITTIDKPVKPSLEDFQTADVYIRRMKEDFIQDNLLKSKWVDRPEIVGYSTLTTKFMDFEIEVIGSLPLYKEFKPETESYSNWIWFKKLLQIKEEYESVHGKPKTVLKLSEWTKRPPRFPLFKWFSK